MKKRILVTGANGFIGSHLVRYCLDQGDAVSCYIRPGANTSLMETIIGGLGRVEILRGYLEDTPDLERAVMEKQVIFHLAGAISAFSQEEYDRVNVGGLRAVADALKSTGTPVERVLFISSSAAAGPADRNQPITEEDKPEPILKYGKSKYRGEEYLKNEASFPWTIIRPPPVFGPGDKVSLQLFQIAKAGFRILIPGKKRYYSFIGVKDLVRGMYFSAVMDEGKNELFFLAHDDYYDWASLLRTISRNLFHRRFPLIPFPIPPFFLLVLGGIVEGAARLVKWKRMPYFNVDKAREATAEGFCVSNRKAKKLLGFTPEQSLAEVLYEAGRWYLDQGWL
jgi:nucleoside-diphosphate-sugar epimerase